MLKRTRTKVAKVSASKTPALKSSKVKISKTRAVYKMISSNGKMFTVVWTTNAGKERKLNGKFKRSKSIQRDQDKIFGYLSIQDYRSGSPRRVNCRTIKELRCNGKIYRVG